MKKCGDLLFCLKIKLKPKIYWAQTNYFQTGQTISINFQTGQTVSINFQTDQTVSINFQTGQTVSIIFQKAKQFQLFFFFKRPNSLNYVICCTYLSIILCFIFI